MTLTEKAIALAVVGLVNVVAIVVGFATGVLGLALAVVFATLSVAAGARILRM